MACAVPKNSEQRLLEGEQTLKLKSESCRLWLNGIIQAEIFLLF